MSAIAFDRRVARGFWRAIALALFGCAPAHAASLQVTPILVELPAPAAASTLKLRNDGPRPLNTQIRVFRWTQDRSTGQDVLEPTDDVVASPPMTTLKSQADYTVRIIRTARATVAKEEAYRLLVDELPDPSRERAGTVAMVLRQSVPVFFMPEAAEPPRLRWSARVERGRLSLTLTNDGGRRVKISGLKVSDGSQSVSFGDGLVGYALAGSSVTWSRPLPRGFGGSVTVSAQGEGGPLHAQVRTSGL